MLVETGAGDAAHLTDEAFRNVGATIVESAKADEAWSSADVVLRVAPVSVDEAGKLREGALLIGFIAPHRNLEAIKVLRDRKVNCLAMELVPRISRAQTMDALQERGLEACNAIADKGHQSGAER